MEDWDKMDSIIISDIKKIKKKVIKLSTYVKKQHNFALSSVKTGDKKKGLEVLAILNEVKILFDIVMEDSLFVLTKNPLATQLRTVMGLLFISRELKKLSGLACNVARFELEINSDIKKEINPDILVIYSIFVNLFEKTFNALLRISSEGDKKKFRDSILSINNGRNRLTIANEKFLESLKSKVMEGTKQDENYVSIRFSELKIISSIARTTKIIKDICENLLFINSGSFTHL